MKVQLKKWGGSQTVIIPPSLLNILDIARNDYLDLTIENQSIVLRKVEH